MTKTENHDQFHTIAKSVFKSARDEDINRLAKEKLVGHVIKCINRKTTK